MSNDTTQPATYDPKLYARVLRRMATIMRAAEPTPDVLVHAEVHPRAVPILYVHATDRAHPEYQPPTNEQLIAYAKRLQPIVTTWQLRGGYRDGGFVATLGRVQLTIELRMFLTAEQGAAFLAAGAVEVQR